jgi:polar amino acid transport system substrate-binding protein
VRVKLSLSFLLLSLLASPARAGEVPLYFMEVPPYTINEAGQKGIVGDIVLEAIRRAGYQAKLIIVPNNRAIMTVAADETANTLIIPLARVSEREALFTWVAPIIKVQRAFFTRDRPIQSFAQARTQLHRIGVARGTAGVNILLDQGFKADQLYQVNEGNIAVKMLQAGRIDAWYGPESQMEFMIKDAGATGAVVKGSALGGTDNYLACSKRCDRAMVDRLNAALAKMEKDSTTKAIIAKYARK